MEPDGEAQGIVGGKYKRELESPRHGLDVSRCKLYSFRKTKRLLGVQIWESSCHIAWSCIEFQTSLIQP